MSDEVRAALATAIRITTAKAEASPADDDFWLDYRSLLLDDRAAVEAEDRMTAELDELDKALTVIKADQYEAREWLTHQLLDVSLCPLHAVDYAICFDDEDPACAQIRLIHPMHDT